MRKKIDIAEKLDKLSKEVGKTLPAFKKQAKAADEKPREKIALSGKPYPLSIKNLIIPESSMELFTKEVTLDPREEVKASQLCGMRDDPRIKVQFTVLKDKNEKEFEDLKSENFKLVKSYLPMYGHEFSGGAMLLLHQGDYTFSMASHELKIEKLIRLFEYALENAWKYELGA
jgi:hypothetical protein